jgi:peptide/nickel transport system permease protein
VTGSDLNVPGPGTRAVGEDALADARPLGLAALAWKRFRRHKLAMAGAVVLIVLALSAVLAPLVSPYNPDKGDFAAFSAAPNSAHLLGTDFAGRDMLSRVLYGGRISLLIGFTSMITAIVFGTILGAVAGFWGGWVDNVIMRLTDVVLSFPLYLLLFVLSAFIAGASGGQNILLIVLVIVAVNWTYIARLVRGQFLSLKEREFTQAAHAIGVAPPHIIIRHLLPNSIAPIVVNATLLVGNNIILESVLSFFGFGVQPPTSSWGSMLADGLPYQGSAPWETIYPGLMILLTVLSVNLLGDGLRDALDPFSSKA